LINPQVPTDLPPRPDDPMLQNPRWIMGTKPPEVLQNSRAVDLRYEWQEGPVNQLLTSFAKISTVGITDVCEDAVQEPATDEALVLRNGAMTRVTPGGIHGGSLLGHRTQFSELPAHLAELGNELLFGLVFVPHAESPSDTDKDTKLSLTTKADNITDPRGRLW